MTSLTDMPADIVEAAKAAYSDYLKSVEGVNPTGGAVKRLVLTAFAQAILAERQRDQWQQIDTAPKDRTPVMLACPNKNEDGFLVGEGYFDPKNFGDGDWWWAGTDADDYRSGPIAEIQYHGPTHWMPLPSPPKGA